MMKKTAFTWGRFSLLLIGLMAALNSCASLMDENGGFFAIGGSSASAAGEKGAGTPDKRQERSFTPDAPSGPQASARLTGLQMKLMEGSSFLLGADSLNVNGRTFSMDCIGVVLALYWYAGIDLSSDFSRYAGNGVARLYRSLDDKGKILHRGFPEPGDILFWDNTYDANGDGRFNDEFTHAGVVIHVLDGGTVEYAHYHYARGIVLERMNLMAPDSRVMDVDGYQILINSPVRARNSPQAPENVSLSSQLLRGIGRAWAR